MLTNRRRRWNGEQGAEIIKFAVVFPLLMMVILGCVDFAWVFQRHEVVTNAAREGARVATLPGYGVMDVENRVTEYLQAGGLPTSPGNPVIVVDQGANVDPCVLPPRSTCGTFAPSAWPATMVTVTYDHDYMFIGAISTWFGGSLTDVDLRTQALMRHELR